MEVAEERGLTFIHPFNDPIVAAGQGSITMEIVQELPLVDAILVPNWGRRTRNGRFHFGENAQPADQGYRG